MTEARSVQPMHLPQSMATRTGLVMANLHPMTVTETVSVKATQIHPPTMATETAFLLATTASAHATRPRPMMPTETGSVEAKAPAMALVPVAEEAAAQRTGVPVVSHPPIRYLPSRVRWAAVVRRAPPGLSAVPSRRESD
jgi:hypothetical protein